MNDEAKTSVMVPASMASVIEAIIAERAAQDAQWGVSDHDPILWMAIIGKHVGRAYADALDGLEVFGNDNEEYITYLQFTQRMIVVAALCCAAAESMNRAEWRWPGGKH